MLTPMQYALQMCMEAMSEEYWRAGWYTGLEYLLWSWVLADAPGIDGPSPRYAAQVVALRALSTEIGGWLVWRDGDPAFVSAAEWAGLYAAHTAGRPL